MGKEFRLEAVGVSTVPVLKVWMCKGDERSGNIWRWRKICSQQRVMLDAMHKYYKKSIDLHLDNHQYQGLSICQVPPISHLPCLPACANSQRESFVSFVGGGSIFPWQSLIRQWTLTWALQTSQKQMSFFSWFSQLQKESC